MTIWFVDVVEEEGERGYEDEEGERGYENEGYEWQIAVWFVEVVGGL